MQERITPIKREPRKRKPAKRYSTSEYDSDDTNGNMECKSIPKAKSMDTFPKMADKSIEAFESQLQEDEKNAYLDYAGYLPRSVIQKRAADLLTTDIDTKPLNGFGEDEIQHGIKEKKWYIEYLKKAEEDLELNVSCNESDVDDCHLPQDFYAKHDFIYLSGVTSKTGIPLAWRSAKKVAGQLRKMFGGNPKVVYPIPQWLTLKVSYSNSIKLWL